MKFNPKIHTRQSIRLKDYDYSQPGLYFITICVFQHRCLFGEINNSELILTDAGKMVEYQWQELKGRFMQIQLHEFIVMPNHFHGIVGFKQIEKGQPQGIAPTVGDVVGAFKSISTNYYIQNVKQNNWFPFDGKLWQRNYYEHVIRNEQSYTKISEYIQTNNMKWQDDKYYVP